VFSKFKKKGQAVQGPSLRKRDNITTPFKREKRKGNSGKKNCLKWFRQTLYEPIVRGVASGPTKKQPKKAKGPSPFSGPPERGLGQKKARGGVGGKK